MNEQWNRISALATTCSVTLDRSWKSLLPEISTSGIWLNYSIWFPHRLAKYIYHWECNSKNESSAILLEPPDHKLLESVQCWEPTSFIMYLRRLRPSEGQKLSRTCSKHVAESRLEPTTAACNSMPILVLFPQIVSWSFLVWYSAQNATTAPFSLIGRTHQ